MCQALWNTTHLLGRLPQPTQSSAPPDLSSARDQLSTWCSQHCSRQDVQSHLGRAAAMLANKQEKLSVLQSVPIQMETDEDTRQKSGAEAGPSKPHFEPLSAYEQNGKKIEFRRVTVPQHRMTPLKNSWMALYKPVTENMKLDMRMNLRTKKVELKTTPDTPDAAGLQKAADFVHAFILGFSVADAIALLRLDDLYVECFEVKDVKTLRGEHLSRCIGRIAGKNGKTKFTIENATKTRIVLADTRIHILGSFQNIKIARDALCGLIMGSPPGKVYSKLRSVCSRLNSSY